jgi:hypothetical protein
MRPKSAAEILRDEVLGSPFVAEAEAEGTEDKEGPRETTEATPLFNGPGGGFVSTMMQANRSYGDSLALSG